MSDYYERPPQTGGITTWDEFHLKCKVKTYTKTWEEPADNNRLHSAEVVVLIPDKNATETWKFKTAWKPEPEEKNTYEFAMFIAPPIAQPARGAYQLPNKWVGEDHIFLMNAALEQDLIRMSKMKTGKWFGKKDLEIQVVIYPEDADHQADAAPDIDKELDKRFL